MLYTKKSAKYQQKLPQTITQDVTKTCHDIFITRKIYYFVPHPLQVTHLFLSYMTHGFITNDKSNVCLNSVCNLAFHLYTM